MPKPWRGSTKTIGFTDLWDRTLGVGNPLSSSKTAGKHRARYAALDLTGGGSTPGTVREYDLPHDLGEAPTVVQLVSYENARGPVTITARGVRPEGWSHSHAFVEVTLIAGSLDGCMARFLVSGR